MHYDPKHTRKLLMDALEGVIRVADRKTIEFDAARKALEQANKDIAYEEDYRARFLGGK